MKVGTPGFVGERLREGREARGLTAVSLSSLLGVSPAAIAQYEAGDQSPRPEIMERICSMLRLPRSFFTVTRQSSGVVFYRSLKSATKTVRGIAEKRLLWVQDIANALAQRLELQPLNIPEIDLPSDPLLISDARIERAAEQCRKYWGLGEEPIPNVASLLERNGVVLARDQLQESLDALSMRSTSETDRIFCIVSTMGSTARARYNLLHELGHAVLHKKLDRWHLENNQLHKLIERQAFKYAACMALPTEAFASDVYSLSLDSFIELKERWGFSIGAMVMRCEDLGIIREEYAQRLWRGIAARGWRTQEPLDEETPFEEIRMLRQGIEYLLAEGYVTADSAEAFFNLSVDDIEELTGIELKRKPSAPVVQMKPRATTTESLQGRKKSGQVIGFGDLKWQ
jgi:Zn-dependent peptidase ImmA (M78 family)/DNA-binding XRE family transcriptional regulator